jgi:hypothetical protein
MEKMIWHCIHVILALSLCIMPIIGGILLLN